MIALLVTILYFVCVGAAAATLLRERLRLMSIDGVADAFLFGIAASGVLSFVVGCVGVPLSRFTWIAALIAAAVILAVRWRTMIGTTASPPRSHNRLLVALAIVPMLIVAADVAFLPLHDYDGRTFWVVKARAIAHEGSISGAFFRGESTENIHSQYPLLMPLNGAAVLSLRGSLDQDDVRWLYALTAMAFAFSARRRIGELFDQRTGDAALAVIAWLPIVSFASDGGAISAYSDLAVAAFVALATFDLLRESLPPSFALWCCALLLTKNEGLPLAAALAIVAVLRHRNRRALLSLAPMVALALLLQRWRALVPNEHDENYAGLLRTLPQKLTMLAPAAGEFFVRMFDVKMWGLFWIAFLVASFVVMRRRERDSLAVLLVIAGGFASYIVAYAVTNWILTDLAAASAHRLLLQMIGPAIVVMCAAINSRAARSLSPLPAGEG